MRGSAVLLSILCAAAALLPACGDHPSAGDRALFERACSQCHPLDLPLKRNRDLKAWRRTVQAMREKGARLTDQEAERVARYLEGIRPRP